MFKLSARSWKPDCLPACLPAWLHPCRLSYVNSSRVVSLLITIDPDCWLGYITVWITLRRASWQYCTLIMAAVSYLSNVALEIISLSFSQHTKPTCIFDQTYVLSHFINCSLSGWVIWLRICDQKNIPGLQGINVLQGENVKAQRAVPDLPPYLTPSAPQLDCTCPSSYHCTLSIKADLFFVLNPT